MSKSRIVVAGVAAVASATLVLGAVPAKADGLTSQTLSITEYPSSKGTYVGNSSALDVTGGGSGNPVTLAVASGSDGVCSAAFTGSSHVAIDYLGAGTCTIAFDQAGSAEYAAAAQQKYTLVIHKNPANATFFIPETATTGQPTSFSGYLHGANNQPIKGERFTFTDIGSEPNTPLCDGVIQDFGLMVCEASFATNGPHKVRANFDGGSYYQSSSLEQTVEVIDPPVVTTTSLPAATVGTPYSYQLQATGSGELYFAVDSEISSWLTLDEDGTLHGTPTEAGDTDVRIAVYDPVGGRTPARFTLVTNPVGKRIPTVSVSYTPRAITAKVSGSGAAPSGSVRFQIDGKSYGSLSLKANGEASKPWNLTPGVRHTVRVFYSGDANYQPGEPGSVVRDDPTLSIKPEQLPNTNNWYRAPVTFTSTCAIATAELVGKCPAPVVYAAEGANRTFSRTITAKDGGSATTTVAAFNLDRTAPSVRLNGVSASATYTDADLPAGSCAASDTLSGIDFCTVDYTISGKKITFTAFAVDKAGNARKALITANYKRA